MSRAFKRLSVLLFLVVAIALLLSLLAAHGADHHGVDLLLFLLVPIFLFGVLAERRWASVRFCLNLLLLKPFYIRPVLFQLPPPTENY